MTQPRRGIGTTIAVVAVVIVLVVATMAFVVLSLQTSTPPHGTASNTSSASSSSSSPSSATPAMSTTTISTLSGEPPCYPAGESGPFGLRILFDSNQSPVAGAQVRATNQPAGESCNGSPSYPLTNLTTVSFTTNNYAGWYYLDSGPDAGYWIGVTYLGQNYNLTASFHPEYAYCLTLFLPSGKTNSTGTEFQTSCP